MASIWKPYRTLAQEAPSSDRTQDFLGSFAANGRVLDFGCCTGNWAEAFLRDRPDLTIDVVDQEIDSKHTPWNGQAYQCDFTEFHPTYAYDGIWARHSLFHMKAKDEMIQVFHRLADALKPQGIFAFTMVLDCDASRAHELSGMRQEEIEKMTASADLSIQALSCHERPYGRAKRPMPIFFIKAKKNSFE